MGAAEGAICIERVTTVLIVRSAVEADLTIGHGELTVGVGIEVVGQVLPVGSPITPLLRGPRGIMMAMSSTQGGIMRALTVSLILVLSFLGAACSPEVGSEAWCDGLVEKPKTDWTAKEAADYAKHCLVR